MPYADKNLIFRAVSYVPRGRVLTYGGAARLACVKSPRLNRLLGLFFKLLRQYGEPGPWPWFGAVSRHSREEIAIGAILTQNVSWRNAENALENLREEKVNTLDGIYRLFTVDQQKLKKLIKPAGFYNQKALYLWEFTKFIILNFKNLPAFFKLPLDEARLRLMAVRGIGPETADTILLYVGRKPIFVIDAYTKKLVNFPELTLGALA